MPILSLLVYSIYVHSLGYFVLSLAANDARLPTSRRLALSGFIGMGLVYLIGISSFIFGLKFNLASYFFVWAGLFVVNCWRREGHNELITGLNSKSFRPFSPTRLKLFWIPYLFVAFQIIYILFSSFWRPVAMNDDWAQWAGNAKYLFYYGYIDQTYFSEVNLSSYPVFIMLNEVLLCSLNGAWSDFFCKSFLVVLFIDFLVFVHSYFYKKETPLISLALVFILVSIPEFVRIGLNGTADNPVSFYAAVFGIQLLTYLETGHEQDIIILGLLAGTLAVIKSETLFLVIGFSGVAVLLLLHEKKINIRHLIVYTGILMIFTGSWIILKKIGECQATRFTQFDLEWLFSISSYKQILTSFAQVILPSKALSIIGIYFLAAAGFWGLNRGRDDQTKTLLLLIAASSVIYAFGCFSTGVAGAFSRLLTHNVGLFVMIIGFQMQSIVLNHSQFNLFLLKAK